MSFRIRVHLRTVSSWRLPSHVFSSDLSAVTCEDCKTNYRSCAAYRTVLS